MERRSPPISGVLLPAQSPSPCRSCACSRPVAALGLDQHLAEIETLSAGARGTRALLDGKDGLQLNGEPQRHHQLAL